MACIWIISCTAGQQRGLTGRGTATGRHANRQAPSLYVQRPANMRVTLQLLLEATLASTAKWEGYTPP